VLADVKPLRLSGYRMSRERLRATPTVRGELSVLRRRGDPWGDERWVPYATLVDPVTAAHQLDILDQVRVARWDGVMLVLVGVEHVTRGKRGKTELTHPQAWWVRLVTTEVPRATVGRSFG
jgi:hypothetical protein